MIAEELIKAGRVAREVREWIKGRDLVGMGYRELAEIVEAEIRRRGAGPAFPCNIGVNEVAAHFTPEIGDEREVRDGDVIKIDIGVHVDGYIADTALTLAYNGDYEPMVKAVEEALVEAVRAIEAGGGVAEVGRAVQGVARRLGYLPISNLSGHGIGRFRVHTGKSIPNVEVPSGPRFGDREVFAIEPFFTTRDGAGYVVDGGPGNIYSLIRRRRLKDPELGRLLAEIWERYRTMPFTPRWLIDEFDHSFLSKAIGRLVKERVIRAYPVLIEGRGRVVAQAEHTIVMSGKVPVILT